MSHPAPALPVRHFLPWSEPLLPQSARLLVEHYAAASGPGGAEPSAGPSAAGTAARMDRAVVVIPGSRAGRRLKELLVEEAGRARVRLVPPRIITQGVLPELLYQPERPTASGALRRLVWAETLAAMNRERLGVVFARLPEGRGPLEWTPLARELAALARTVAAGGYRLHDVAERVAASHLYDDTPRWRVLAAVQERVEARLTELGYVDPDLARMTARDEGRIYLDGDLWLVGVAETTGVLRGMIMDAVQAGTQVHALVHAAAEPGTDDQRDRDFDLLGCIRPEGWTNRHLPVTEDRIRVVDRPEDQARETLRILAGLGPVAPEDVVIGAPSSEVVPAMDQLLPAAGVPIRDAAGEPLSGTGPYRLLAAAASWLDERRYEALAGLVRHPDLRPALEADPEVAAQGAWEQDPDRRLPYREWLTGLDHWYQRTLPARMSSPFPEMKGYEAATARAVVNRVDNLLAPLAGRAPLSSWGEPILRLLAGVYTPLGLSESRLSHRRILRALEELRWAVEAVVRLPGEVDATCSGAQAIRFVLEEAASTRIPAPPNDDAVEVLGWLELHLDDAPLTIVTGVNEGSLPESVRGDAFLPDALRRLLRLEDNGQRHARDVYRMAAMWHSRDELWLVSGRRTAAGDPLRPSRLLFAADDATVATRVRRFYGDEGSPAEAGAADGAGSETDDADRSGFHLPPESILFDFGMPTRVSVTQFRTLLEDPWLWRLQQRYALDTLNDQALEMDALVFGNLGHDVLQAWGQGEIRRQADGQILTDPEKVWGVLEPELDRIVAARFGKGASLARVAVRLQVEQLRSRLRAFADWQAGWAAQGWRIRAAEVGTPRSDGVPFDYGAPEDRAGTGSGKITGLSARIDRVDHHPESGEWAVFDYKTSDAGDAPEKVHRRGRGDDKVWKDLQLPLYHWLVTRLTNDEGVPLVPVDPDARPPRIRLGYINLPRDLAAVGFAEAPWSTDEIEDGIERAREALREVDGVLLKHDPSTRSTYPDPEMDALLGRSILSGNDGDDDGLGDGMAEGDS